MAVVDLMIYAGMLAKPASHPTFQRERQNHITAHLLCSLKVNTELAYLK